MNYLRYWVDGPAGKIFCLVDAPDAETASEVHRKAHGPSPKRSSRSASTSETGGGAAGPGTAGSAAPHETLGLR